MTERRDDKNREPSTLVDRLRGIYNIPVNDGAGPLDGKDTYTREFGTTPIQSEAADRIEQLERELAHERTERMRVADEFIRFMQIAGHKVVAEVARSAIATAEPVAWLIEFSNRQGEPSRAVHLQNAVGDYREQMDSQAKATPLYAAPQASGEPEHDADSAAPAGVAPSSIAPLASDAGAVWAILYEDTDCKPEVFTGAGAEEAARARWAAVRTNYNVALLQPAHVTPSATATADAAVQELRNIVNAKRFDRDAFTDDSAFVDWALNRCRYTLAFIDANRASE